MKIAFVLDDTLDKPDGVQQYVLTLGVWLTEHGHDVHYLSVGTTRSDIAQSHSIGRYISLKFNGNGVRTPLPVSRRAIKRLLQHQAFDVLHVQMPYSPLFAKKIINQAPASTAVVATFHIMPATKAHKQANRLLAVWLRRSLRRIDAFMSVSVAAQSFASRVYGITSIVIPNMVDVGSYKAVNTFPRSTDKQKIVFLGRLVSRKGCQYLLEAIATLTARYQAFEVVIAGTGKLHASLQAYVAQHRLDSFVHFVGFVDERDKPGLLSSADIAVFPSTAGESFGIVLIEAMSAGSGVVIGGNNPGYSSVLQDPEVLFNPKDTHAFAALLETLLRDPTYRKQLHKRQQERVKLFDSNVVAPQVVALYSRQIVKRQESLK